MIRESKTEVSLVSEDVSSSSSEKEGVCMAEEDGVTGDVGAMKTTVIMEVYEMTEGVGVAVGEEAEEVGGIIVRFSCCCRFRSFSLCRFCSSSLSSSSLVFYGVYGDRHHDNGRIIIQRSWEFRGLSFQCIRSLFVQELVGMMWRGLNC